MHNCNVPDGLKMILSSQQTVRWYLVRIETIIILINYDSQWHFVEPLLHNYKFSFGPIDGNNGAGCEARVFYWPTPKNVCCSANRVSAIRRVVYRIWCGASKRSVHESRDLHVPALIDYHLHICRAIFQLLRSCGNVSNLVGEIETELSV